eukprot:TRINITY_DN3018_c0_g1_i3.p1 TRINITY_DN3018_c0_g1~~TRINITY_DN3018_c0_g1_i3.p1  ORF type:complete len:181 (-),score=17.31 TRINITY_DN3018_c0_g1_i3:19-561(-)
MSSGRYFVHSKIKFFVKENGDHVNYDIDLICCHLDIWDETEATRFKEIQQILRYYDKLATDSSNFLISGDFNSLRRKDYEDERWNSIVIHDLNRSVTPQTLVTDELEKKNFVDSFQRKSLPVPQCTTWSNRRIDFMYTSPKWNLNIGGCYVYHSAASDHLPIVMDIALPNEICFKSVEKE